MTKSVQWPSNTKYYLMRDAVHLIFLLAVVGWALSQPNSASDPVWAGIRSSPPSGSAYDKPPYRDGWMDGWKFEVIGLTRAAMLSYVVVFNVIDSHSETAVLESLPSVVHVWVKQKIRARVGLECKVFWKCVCCSPSSSVKGQAQFYKCGFHISL